jgi:tol-pal system protein YbgF
MLNQRHSASFSSSLFILSRKLQMSVLVCSFFVPVLYAGPALAQMQDQFTRSQLSQDQLPPNDFLDDAPPPRMAAAPNFSSNNFAGSPNSYQANVEMRLSDLENQIRQLRGEVERLQFQNNQLQSKLDRALSDIEVRLNDAAQSSAPAPSQSPLPPTPQTPSQNNNVSPPFDPNAPAPANSPTQRDLGQLKKAPGGAAIPPTSNDPAVMYENAFSQLKNGDYATAQRSFDQFLKKFPEHPLAANATYWYGESFYAQQKYDSAARIFAESYRKYPKGSKAADSLLKLGMALGNSGKKREACVTLRQLKKEFPTGQSSSIRRADQEIARLSCPS